MVYRVAITARSTNGPNHTHTMRVARPEDSNSAQGNRSSGYIMLQNAEELILLYIFIHREILVHAFWRVPHHTTPHASENPKNRSPSFLCPKSVGFTGSGRNQVQGPKPGLSGAPSGLRVNRLMRARHTRRVKTIVRRRQQTILRGTSWGSVLFV